MIRLKKYFPRRIEYVFMSWGVAILAGCAGFSGLNSTASEDPAKRPAVEVGQAGSGRAVIVTPDKAAARTVAYVYQGQYTYVRIEQREPGAETNQHPYAIDAAQLETALADIKIPSKKTADSVFNKDELQELVPKLVIALAKVTPEQDVTFAISGRHNFLGPLAPRVVTTGRIFYQKDQLQLIFGLIHAEFEGQFRATGWLMPFEPGSRKQMSANLSKITLTQSRGHLVRTDWVALNLTPLSSEGSATAQVPSSSGAKGSAEALPANGVVGSKTSSAGRASAAADNGMKPDANALAKSIGERLKALDQLKRDGLVNEQEYQEKRKAILKDL